jgi:hypothetical protein
MPARDAELPRLGALLCFISNSKSSEFLNFKIPESPKK